MGYRSLRQSWQHSRPDQHAHTAGYSNMGIRVNHVNRNTRNSRYPVLEKETACSTNAPSSAASSTLKIYFSKLSVSESLFKKSLEKAYNYV